MKQEINFLKSRPKAPNQLPAKLITFAVIGTLALCTLISLNMAVSTIEANKVVIQERAESINATLILQKAARTYPLLASEQSLDQQIKTLKQELQNKQTEYETLTRTTLRHGFSNYLQTLAQLVPEGLWLTDIKLNQETNDATLGGYMLTPVAVSQLLHGLQLTEMFAKFKFHLFYVKQVKDRSYAEFKVASTTLNEGKSK